MPLVSILLTSYNHEKYIKESIQSVLDQTFGDFELLIVDDCSKDASFEVISAFDDSRITAVKNPVNMGPEHAFELLHKTAKGKYIAIADSDNRWHPDKLQKQVDFLDSHPEYTAVFTKASYIDKNGNPNTTDATARYDIFNVENRSRHEWLNYFLYNDNCLCHPSILIRREAYAECGMTANGLWQIPDFYKWIRLCLKRDIFVLDEKLIEFRLHGANVSDMGNLNNLLRISNEESQRFRAFYEMSEEDFRIAFPAEAEKYTVNGKINTTFALSKILLTLDWPQAKTLALSAIFDLLNDPVSRVQLAELYNYDDVSYKQDETGNIPYISNCLTDTSHTFTTSLYFDLGDGFNEGSVMTKRVFSEADGNFSVTFSGIKSFCGEKKLLGMRFDPDFNPVKAHIDGVSCESGAIAFEPNTAGLSKHQHTDENGFDVFYTGDPSYILCPPAGEIDSVTLKGKMFEITKNTLLSSVDSFANELDVSRATAKVELERVTAEREYIRNDLTSRLDAANARINDLEIKKAGLESQLNYTQAQLDLTLNSISWKITRPIRGIKKLAKKILKR